MEKQSFSFADLSPDVLLDALDSVEVHAESGLLALNSYENRVYQFKAEDGQRYVTKTIAPHDGAMTKLMKNISLRLNLNNKIFQSQRLSLSMATRYITIMAIGLLFFQVSVGVNLKSITLIN